LPCRCGTYVRSSMPELNASSLSDVRSVARGEREWRDSVAAKPHDAMSAPRTPSPKKGGDSDESSDVSPGALALMAELVHESSPPRVSSPKPSGELSCPPHPPRVRCPALCRRVLCLEAQRKSK